MKMEKPVQNAQAHAHQSVPADSIIQRIIAASGAPIRVISSAPLSRSIINSFGVMRLNLQYKKECIIYAKSDNKEIVDEEAIE